MDLSENLITEARELYANTEYKAEFITADVLQLQAARRYDMVICQAVLRHIDHAERFVEKMVEMLQPGGLLVSIECNREFEEDGLYIDGMDYGYLCEHEGHISLWEQEREKQGRDYAAAMKIPGYLRKAGLVNVDCRLNDRVTYLEPGQEDYQEMLSDLRNANGWDRVMSKKELENRIAGLMKHGMKRWEAEKYCKQQGDITRHLAQKEKEVSLVKITGQMIAYGWKTENE